jgi:hypothetical protein
VANEFASTTNTETSGILKNAYETEPVGEALKRKRKKLAETQIGLQNEDENNKES